MMPLLTDAARVALWERGRYESAARRAFDVLSVAFPERPVEALAALTLGERDRLLMQVRGHTFGWTLEARASCASCGEALELAVDLAAIAATPGDTAGSGWFDATWNDWTIRFRLPTIADLFGAAGGLTPGQALIAACIEAAHAGQPVCGSDLPGELLDVVREHMTTRDPLLDVQLDVQCSSCGHTWQMRLDMSAYLWAELCADAQTILDQVHRVASMYHWRETDILAMSRWRRQQYLRRIGDE